MNITFTTVEIAALIVAFEFAIVAWLGPVFLLRRKTRASHIEKVEVAALMQGVEEKAPSRRDALATILATTYQLEGDDLEAKVAEFVEREQAFYKVMTSVYLERDSEGLKALPDELTKVVAPWIRMTPESTVDTAALDALESQNDALQQELGDTKRNMEELMNEYLGAFDKDEKLKREADNDAEHGGTTVEEPAAGADISLDDELDFAADDELLDGETPAAEAVTDTVAVAPLEAAEATAALPPDAPESTGASEAPFSIDVSADDDDEQLSQDDLDKLFSQDLDPIDDAESSAA